MKKFLVFFIVFQLYIFLSNYPIIKLANRTPANSNYPFIDVDRFGDYNGYLSAITQGQNGFLFFHNPYTTEESPANLFYLPYLAAGWINRMFDFPSFIVFHGMKIIIAELYGLALYIFCSKLFSKRNALIASLLALTATVPPSFVFDIFGIPSTNSWWRLQDAFFRLSEAPHHVFGETLLIISFIFLLKAMDHNHFKYFTFSGIFAFLCGVIFPPSVLPFIAVCIGILFLDIVFRFKENYKAELIRFAIPLVFALSSIGIGIFQLNQGYYRDVWSTWEVTRWNINEPDFNKIFIISLNIFPFFVLLYFVQTIRKVKFTEFIKDRINIFILIWSLLPFFLIPFASFIGLSKIRLYAMVPFVSFSFIFCWVIFTMFRKNIAVMLLLFVICLNFLTSVSLLIQNINRINNQPLYSNIYYPDSQWNAINFLKHEAPNQSVVLSDENIGNIIPAFIPITSYFGHVNLTVHFKEKQNKVWRFYTENMKNEEAEKFIHENHISYIWYGTEEKALGNKTISYPFLKSIYQNGEIIIFKAI